MAHLPGESRAQDFFLSIPLSQQQQQLRDCAASRLRDRGAFLRKSCIYIHGAAARESISTPICIAISVTRYERARARVRSSIQQRDIEDTRVYIWRPSVRQIESDDGLQREREGLGCSWRALDHRGFRKTTSAELLADVI